MDTHTRTKKKTRLLSRLWYANKHTELQCKWPEQSPSLHLSALQWRHNERDGVSNHRRLDCLLKCLFRRRSKKTLEFRVTVFVRGNHRWPVDSHHKGPVTRKRFPFDGIVMDCFSNKSQYFFHRIGPFLKLVYLSIGLWSFITSHSVLCMCVLCGRRWGNVLTLNVRGPSYLCLIRSISWLLMPWLLTSPGHQQPWYWLLHILYYINGLTHDFWTRAGGWEFDRSHGAGTSSPSHWQQVEEQAPKPVGWTMCFLLMTLVPVQKFCVNIYVYICMYFLIRVLL